MQVDVECELAPTHYQLASSPILQDPGDYPATLESGNTLDKKVGEQKPRLEAGKLIAHVSYCVYVLQNTSTVTYQCN